MIGAMARKAPGAPLDPDLTRKLAAIRLLLLDVDGVLTEGGIAYTDAGEEIKTFSVKDGLGIKLVMKAGLAVGIITSRKGKALKRRCADLGIEMVFDGVGRKETALGVIYARTGFAPDETAYVGDDLPDLAVFQRVGLAIAVADAADDARASAHMITKAGGGRGAVREVCEAILKARGLWAEMVDCHR